eukprot:scaffold3608_cov65-Phaeocystis_antarctica.AAC.3
MSNDVEAGSSLYGRPSVTGLASSPPVRKVFTTYCLPWLPTLGCTLDHKSVSMVLRSSQYLSNSPRSSRLSSYSASGGSMPDENLAHAKLSPSLPPEMISSVASKSMSRSLPSVIERTRLSVCVERRGRKRHGSEMGVASCRELAEQRGRHASACASAGAARPQRFAAPSRAGRRSPAAPAGRSAQGCGWQHPSRRGTRSP